jgi:hypothetical protein
MAIMIGSRKANMGIETVIWILVGLMVFAVLFFGPTKLSAKTMGTFSACETFGGVIATTCDPAVSKVHALNNIFSREGKVCCTPLPGVDETDFENFKLETSTVERTYFGVKVKLGESAWLPPMDDFKEDSSQIYVKYNNNTGLIPEGYVIDNFNNGPFKLEFANAFDKGDYCQIKIIRDGKELDALSRDWSDCSNKARVLKDFKGVSGESYEVNFIVKTKKDASDLAKRSVTIKMVSNLGSSTNPQIEYTFDAKIVKGEDIVITEAQILNKKYEVIKILGDDFSKGNYKLITSKECKDQEPMENNKLLLSSFNFNFPISLEDLGNNNLCIYLKNSSSQFSSFHQVEKNKFDAVIVIKNENIKICSQYSAKECLDITKRTSESTKCYLDDSSCRDCDTKIVDCSSYKTPFTCNSNDCIGTKCYWDYKNVNECLSCSKINSCSSYSDDRDECLANTCGIKGGCKYVEPSWNDWDGDCVNK